MKSKKKNNMVMRVSSITVPTSEALLVLLTIALGLALCFSVAHNIHFITLTSHPSHVLGLIWGFQGPTVILLYSRYRKDQERCSIGEQDLAFGLKFNAKGVVDCYENPLEKIGDGLKREIEFNMVEGDFEIFRGKWSLQQLNTSGETASDPLVDQNKENTTTLSYLVDVKPKMLLPVRLVEGRLCREIIINLASIRKEAMKVTRETLLTRQ